MGRISMTIPPLSLILLDDRLAVCRLDPKDAIPAWATGHEFFSITRTAAELSVVCPEAAVPEGVRVERGWRALRVAGVLPFSLVGVLASLTAPLAEAGVSLFALSTFDTDYLLIREPDLDRAIETLLAQGHVVLGRGQGGGDPGHQEIEGLQSLKRSSLPQVEQR